MDADAEVFGKAKRFFFSGDAAETSAISWAVSQNDQFQRTGKVEEPARGGRTKDSAKSVSIMAVDYLKDKKGDVTPDQLKNLKNHLGKLCKQFGGLDMDAVEPFECRVWLKEMDVAQRTRHGIFTSCRAFYRWAMRYGRATTNPFDRMEPVPKGEAPKAILEPEEMEMLLAREMTPYLRAWLVLGGFCGLRPVEVTRSDWSAINWQTGEFHVRPEATKRDRLRNRGMKERIVKMPDAALRLLPRDQTGKIVPVSATTLQEQVCRLAVALAKHRGEPLRKKKWWRRGKVTEIDTADWPHDCLRHSAATYKLGVEDDAGPVAKWLGHTTTKMIYDSYARPKSRAVAERWWAIGQK